MAAPYRKRKIRIEYFRVVKSHDGYPDELFDFRTIIEIWDQLSLAERRKIYYQDDVRIDEISYDKINDYWALKFVRLRQTGIPSIASENQVAQPIRLLEDEYIGEEASAIYDVKNHILVLQRNRDSLGPSGLETYLNQFYQRTDESMVSLRPIRSLDLNEKLKNVKEYKKITLRFADISSKAIKDQTNLSFGQFFNTCKAFKANTATITMSLGRGRNNGSLDKETIQETVSSILENKDMIETAELNVKTSELEPVETIDLFSQRSHDFIEIKVEKLETIAFEQIVGTMIKKYARKKPEILKLL